MFATACGNKTTFSQNCYSCRTYVIYLLNKTKAQMKISGEIETSTKLQKFIFIDTLADTSIRKKNHAYLQI